MYNQKIEFSFEKCRDSGRNLIFRIRITWGRQAISMLPPKRSSMVRLVLALIFLAASKRTAKIDSRQTSAAVTRWLAVWCDKREVVKIYFSGANPTSNRTASCEDSARRNSLSELKN